MNLWRRIKKVFFYSLTVAWTIVCMIYFTLLSWPDISNTLGIQNYLPTELQPKYMFGVMFVTLLARFRSIIWKTRRHKAIFDYDEDDDKHDEDKQNEDSSPAGVKPEDL